MVEDAAITLLEARKQLLLTESGALRRRLADCLDPLEETCARVDQGIALARSLWAVWPLVAAVVGFAAARRRRGFWSILRRGWALWRLGRRALAGWREYA